MDHYIDIYSQRARDYHRLIEREDVDGNILPCLEKTAELVGRRVVDLGSGTGRLPLLLDGVAGEVVSVERYTDMLREQARQKAVRGGSWEMLCADIRAVPLADRYADIVTAGWAIGHYVGWYGGAWREQVDAAMEEMHRLVRRGGTLVLMETMGTGTDGPAPPNPGLAVYYDLLARKWGFSAQPQVIQTDYQFESLDEAGALAGFFFGADLERKIRKRQWKRLPEWTGVWSKSV